MITLFTCPRPFRGVFDAIQRNAIASWARLTPQPEIILLGDDPGVAEVSREFGLQHVPEVTRNEYGTPLVSSVFETGQKRARYNFVAYVNCDILLLSDFLPAVRTVSAKMKQFLMLGQRWDLDLHEAWDFTPPSWEADLRGVIAREGVLHAQTAMDYFVFPRGLYRDIPAFAIGRTAWDNWLMWRARSRGVPVVDATPVVTIAHQNHDWERGKITVIADRPPASGPRDAGQPAGPVAHLAGKTVVLGPEAQRNRALAPGAQGQLDIWAATWTIRKDGALVRRPISLSPDYLKWQLKWVLPMKWPWFGSLYRAAASVRHGLPGASRS